MNNFSTPICPHFNKCSGCELPLDEVPAVWSLVIKFFASFFVQPTLHRLRPTEWRLKAKLAIRGSPSDPLIGLFRKNSHEVISIPHCLVHHPSINRAVSLISEAIRKTNISLYDEKKQKGLLRYLQLFVQRESGKVQLSLVVNSSSLEKELHQLCFPLQGELWHSVWVNFHPAANNRVLGDSWEKIHGDLWLYQPFLQESIPFHPGAFSQANLELFEQLVFLVSSWVPLGSRVVELFAGVGLIGTSLLGSCEKLLLVENNPFAFASFQARYPKILPCEYRLEDASQFEEFSSFDTLIVDPPRKGLGPLLLKKLANVFSLRLIYISCGWESFQSDCQFLINSGWSLKKAEGFFLFPGTNHVEIAAFLEK